jgi:excisionase family DNA binding protein
MSENDMSENDPRFLTVKQWCALTKTSRSRAYERMKSGEIPSVLIGRSRRIPASVLEALERKAHAASAE